MAFGIFFVLVGALAIFIGVGVFGWVMLVGGGVSVFIAVYRRSTGGSVPAAKGRSAVVLVLIYGGLMATILGLLLQLYAATN